MSKLYNKVINITEEIAFKQEKIFKSVQQLYQESVNVKPIKKFWGQYIGEGDIVHFPSPRGAGKTLLLMQICMAISGGQESFLGEQIEINGNTIYINLELNNTTIMRRIRKLMDNPPFQIKNDYKTMIFTYKGSLLSELTNIVKEIDFYKPILIVIDNLRLAFIGSDVNSGKEITKLMFTLMAIRDALGCSIVITDHFRKHTSNLLTGSDLHSGSGATTDLSDADMFLRKSCQQTNWRIMKRCKSRNFEEDDTVKLIQLDAETLWFKLVEASVCEAEHIGVQNLSDKNEQIDMAKQLRTEGRSMEEIGKIMNKNKSTISRWLKE